LSFGEKFIPLFDHLMRSANEIDVLLFEEVGYDIRPEDETYATFVLAPAIDAFLGVRPEEVTEEPLIRDFDWPHDFEDLFKALELGTKPTMHTHDFLIHQGTNRHDVENIREKFP
jgi:hypothetical protein